jgi:hypothetical protein
VSDRHQFPEQTVPGVRLADCPVNGLNQAAPLTKVTGHRFVGDRTSLCKFIRSFHYSFRFHLLFRRFPTIKQSIASGCLKKDLSNEEPSDPMHQNYLFPTALAIIFTLKPLPGIGPSSPGPFPAKTCH